MPRKSAPFSNLNFLVCEVRRPGLPRRGQDRGSERSAAGGGRQHHAVAIAPPSLRVWVVRGVWGDGTDGRGERKFRRTTLEIDM